MIQVSVIKQCGRNYSAELQNSIFDYTSLIEPLIDNEIRRKFSINAVHQVLISKHGITTKEYNEANWSEWRGINTVILKFKIVIFFKTYVSIINITSITVPIIVVIITIITIFIINILIIVIIIVIITIINVVYFCTYNYCYYYDFYRSFYY